MIIKDRPHIESQIKALVYKREIKYLHALKPLLKYEFATLKDEIERVPEAD